MSQFNINLWVIVLHASITSHVVEAFAPCHPLFSNDCSISTTSTAIFNSPSDNNTQSRDTRELSFEELKIIAFRKGYDTVGVDRSGLETIVNFFEVDEDFTVEGDPPEVDMDSLADGYPLYGCIPREMREKEQQSRDTNELSIEELKIIAFRKGFDTVGVDREGLEIIANFEVEEDFTVEGDPPEVDENSLADGWPLFGFIPREMRLKEGLVEGQFEEQTEEQMEEQMEGQSRKLDMVPTSYNRLKTPEGAVYADRDMDFADMKYSGNANSTPQPQNQFQPQFSEQVTSPAQSQPLLQSEPNQSQSQSQLESSEVSQPQLVSDPLIIALLKSPTLRASIVGFITGIVAVSPVTYLDSHNLPSELIENESSQFLFDTLTGGISAAAFATVYRYFIEPNPNKSHNMRNNIVGLFIICRSVSRIRASAYCDGLICGAPLGFMDWDMLQAFAINSFEDLALFGAAALVLEYACEKGFVPFVKDPRNNLE